MAIVKKCDKFYVPLPLLLCAPLDENIEIVIETLYSFCHKKN